MDSVTHPCFSFSACKQFARMHMPVAPDCNIQCSFCNRDYDCVNESRPGVTSKILSPEEAFEKFVEVRKKIHNLTVVGFAGPGDPLANWEKVKKTAELVKTQTKDIQFCLSTNGLNLPKHADELIETGFSYITVTINAVSIETAAKIYTRVDVEELLKKQMQGLEYLTSRGVTCKVNTIVLPGINEHEIEDIAQNIGQKDAFIMNIRQVLPVSEQICLDKIRKKCSKYVKQMYHCRQCRADAIGMLDDDRCREFY